jgi:hypothetical protein
MLKVSAVDIDKLKAELKIARQHKIQEAKSLRKAELKKAQLELEREAKISGLAKSKIAGKASIPAAALKRIEEMEKSAQRYGSMVPVRVGYITIDFKSFEAMCRKLKGFETSITFEGDWLILTYTDGKAKGKLQLRDITHFFESFKLPEAEVLSDAG